jgi:hypothetical protein
MEQIIIQIIIALAMLLLSELTRPKPDKPPMAGLGDLEFPTTSQDRKVPVFCGTPILRSPNLVWYGGLLNIPITRKIDGMFIDDSVVVGYQFWVGKHLVMGIHPRGSALAQLKQIIVDNTVLWDSTKEDLTTNGDGTKRGLVSQVYAFGGEEQEGGVFGEFDFMQGDPGQLQNDYLVTQTGSRTPAYRRLISLVWRGGYLGTSKYIKPWFFVCTRLPARIAPNYAGIYTGNGTYTTATVTAGSAVVQLPANYSDLPEWDLIENGHGVIVKGIPRGAYITSKNSGADTITMSEVATESAANVELSFGPRDQGNPAEFFYEVLTDDQYGMALPALKVNEDTFAAAAELYYREGLGLSPQWDRTLSIESLLSELKKYTDSLLFEDFKTGQYKLIPNRKSTQEEIDTLPVLDQDNCEVESLSMPTVDELVNEVRATYTDIKDQKRKSVVAHNLGMYQTQDKQPISVNQDYKWAYSKELADILVSRDLRSMSFPLKTVQLKTNRIASAWSQGQKFVLNWEPDGISNLIMIVVKIGYGTPGEGEVSIEAIQDVFEIGEAFYTTPVSEWQPPNTSPEEVVEADALIDEVPYWINKLSKPADPWDAYRPMILAKAPTPASLKYTLFWQNQLPTPSAWVENRNDKLFTPCGTLVQDYPRTNVVDTSSSLFIIPPANMVPLVSLTNGNDIRKSGRNIVIIDGEIMAFKTLTYLSSGLLRVDEVWRGGLDTTVKDIAAGASVWFISSGMMASTDTYWDEQPLELKYRLLTTAVNGKLTFDEAGEIDHTFVFRADKPLPAMDVKINGENAPMFVVGDTTVTFDFRNRLDVAHQDYIPQTDAGVALEDAVNGEFTLEFLDAADVVQHTEVLTSTVDFLVAATSTSFNFTQATEDGLPYDTDGAYTFKLTSTVDGLDAHMQEVIKYHRAVAHPGGDLHDALLEDEAFSYWGFEE